MDRPKIALVTGSSKGMGKAIAIRLGQDGYHVYVTFYSDEEAGHRTVKEIVAKGGSATLCHLNVRDEESVTCVMRKIVDDQGHLEVLVNNAVKEIPRNIEDASFEEWETVIATKLHGAFLATKHALPLLKKGDNPNVIIITSHEGEKPNPDYLAYGVGTSALIGFTKAMAVYLPKYGIRVNAVSPGEVRTPLWNYLGDENNDELWDQLAKQNPMQRVATVYDVADAVMFLISDPHGYLNGNFLYVNGGNHLRQ